jgi:bacillithiol biosynthesis cysteine-adding enzyme BshC
LEVVPCSYRQINASALIQDYTSDFPKVSRFYTANPFDAEAVKSISDTLQTLAAQQHYVEALSSYHTDLGIKELQAEALSRLANPGVQVVVTGQQLGLAGGLLFTIYKTLTAIYHARKWSKEMGREILPVFWMADEDHDYDEINVLRFPGFDETDTIKLPDDDSLKPVSAIEIKEWGKVQAELKKMLPETDFNDDLIELINDCYKEGRNHAQAFGRLIARVFEGSRLIIAGSQHPEIKKLLKPVFQTSVEKRTEIEKALNTQSKEIGKEYHQQVQLGSTNLFYLDEHGKRLKISFENTVFSTDHHQWSKEELINSIDEKPDSFSPNVFQIK